MKHVKRLECLLLFSCSVLLETLSTRSTAAYQEKLPRVFASPLNIDSELDCAIKELAWEFAKKLLPRVNQIHGQINLLHLIIMYTPFFLYYYSMAKISWYTMHYS